MLETKTTSITLRGVSSVTVAENQVQVVDMYASINEFGNSSISSSIINQELYDKNKTECRADMDAFTEKVREIEDAGICSLIK